MRKVASEDYPHIIQWQGQPIFTETRGSRLNTTSNPNPRNFLKLRQMYVPSDVFKLHKSLRDRSRTETNSAHVFQNSGALKRRSWTAYPSSDQSLKRIASFRLAEH